LGKKDKNKQTNEKMKNEKKGEILELGLRIFWLTRLDWVLRII
jgi:hypothetical protein